MAHGQPRGGVIPAPPLALSADMLTVHLQTEKLPAGEYHTEIAIWMPQAVELTRIPVMLRVRPHDSRQPKASPETHAKNKKGDGAGCRDRTGDLLITRQLAIRK